MNQSSPLPIVTALAYAMSLTARRAHAIRYGGECVAPDCIIVDSPSPLERAQGRDIPSGEPPTVYIVCIGDCRQKHATLDEAIAFANDVLAARTDSAKAIHAMLDGFSARAAA